MTDHPSRAEMWVTCPPCKYTWIVAYLPMEMAKAARVMKAAHCPKCGEKKVLTVATEAEIVAATTKVTA